MSSSTPNLIDIFKQLETPDAPYIEENRLSALPIPGLEGHRLGKDPEGSPVLLLSTKDAAPQTQFAPIALEHLLVQHNVECQISYPNGRSETRFC